MSNRTSPGCDWRTIAAELRRAIVAGELAPGSRLPSLSAFARERGMTSHAVRRAMRYLCDAGYAVSLHGRGHYVAEDRFVYRIHSGTRFGSNLLAEGKLAETRLLDTGIVRASAEVAYGLGLRAGAPVVRVELLRLVEGRPAIIGRHHYRTVGRYAAIPEHLAATGSVSAAFRRLGLSEFRRRETLIGTRLPSLVEAETLQISTSQPLIMATGINVDAQDEPVEVSVSLSRGDRVKLHA